MFFSLSRSPKLNFSVNGHYHRGWHFDMDAGWSIVEHNRKTVAWKGYIDQGDLDFEIFKIIDSGQAQSGNYCAVVIDDEQASVLHSSPRSFPLWYSPEHGVTNLRPIGRPIYSDSVITLNRDLSFVTNNIDVIGFNNVGEQSSEQVIENVDQILSQRFATFFEYNTRPVKIFLTGGIDTTLMLSYLRRLEIKHEVVLAEHIEFDRFWVRNHHTLTANNWAYKQMHHWTKPTVLVSGAPGDEYTLRNPEMANLLAMHHGTSLNELLETRPCLHKEYLLTEDNQNKFQRQQHSQETRQIIQDKDKLYRHLLDQAANDHQHWHLGNTLTFTPLRDLNIFKEFLSLSWADQINQMLDSTISRQLIEQNDPDLLKILSVQKNTGNYLENLVHLL
jgi:hypothetical protein